MKKSIHSRHARRSRHGGFTLVELLVVLGIICVLISVLMPAIGKARRQAKLVSCASNLRQYGQILHMYASQNRGHVPLYYSGWIAGSSVGATNFICSSHFAYGMYTPLGTALYNSGLVRQIKPFYCPLLTNNRYSYAVPTSNPWPSASAAGGASVRLGYCVRPEKDYSPVFDSSSVQTGFSFVTSVVKPWPKITHYRPNQAMASDHLPRLATADTLGNPGWPPITMTHLGQAANVCYFDGSVRRIPYDVYKANYVGRESTPNIMTYADTARTILASGFWYDFDHAR